MPASGEGPSLLALATAPARLAIDVVLALPRLAAGLERLATIGESLDRIAAFDETLEEIANIRSVLDEIVPVVPALAQLADLGAVLDRLADATQSLGSLTQSAELLQASAGELASAVQPLQGVAQRVNRLVTRRADRKPEALPGS